MSVRIRMKKFGRRHRPFYRICAMDGRTPRDGKAIEELGYYDPSVKETDARTVLNAERIDYWLSVGAQPSEKVQVLIKKYGSNGTHLEQQKQALERLKATKPTPPPPMVVSQPQKPAEAAPEQAAPAPEATAEASEPAEPSTGEAGGE